MEPKNQTQQVEDACSQQELLFRWLSMLGVRFVTMAEFYLSLGRAVRLRLRHGATLEEISCGSGLPIYECLLTLQYAESDEVLKFQALVENWSWEKIKENLRSPQNHVARR